MEGHNPEKKKNCASYIYVHVNNQFVKCHDEAEGSAQPASEKDCCS